MVQSVSSKQLFGLLERLAEKILQRVARVQVITMNLAPVNSWMAVS